MKCLVINLLRVSSVIICTHCSLASAVKLSTRIVGGGDTEDLPWIVSLKNSATGNHFLWRNINS
jgi:hypothetical protein